MKRIILLCAAVAAGSMAARADGNAVNAVDGMTYTNSGANAFPSGCDYLLVNSSMTITIDGVVRSRSSECYTSFIVMMRGITCTLKLKNSNNFIMNETQGSGIAFNDHPTSSTAATLVIQQEGIGSLTIHNTNTSTTGTSIGGHGGFDGEKGVDKHKDTHNGGSCEGGDWKNGGNGHKGIEGGDMGMLIINSGSVTADRIGGGDAGNGGRGGHGFDAQNECNSGTCHSAGNGGNGGDGGTIKIYGGTLTVATIRGSNGGNGGKGGNGGRKRCSGKHDGKCGKGGSGGEAKYGGIFWADVRELYLPLRGFTQVVGHNRVSKIKEHTNNGGRIIFCDCLFNNDYLKI